ncbi:TetR/AcrR family transcriptional regulator [Virgibacillus sp. CBA3643]|uniref:TetR/AcrR family transcriptional regulator n=1 Tax=Virgibacillus sp. CBA3643 TaxID=2942278 RepID=UPI0035A3C93C
MKKNEIIQATIHNFAAHGYHGATMSKIAKEVDIKPASLYYFFKNKEDLFKEAIDLILDNHFSSMRTSFLRHQNENIIDLFSELLRSIVSHHTGNIVETRAYVAMISSPIPNVKKEVSEYLTHYNNWLFENLTGVIERHHPDLTEHKIREVIDYFIFIGNGLFWGIVIYEKEGIQQNLKQSIYSLEQCIPDMLRSD